MIPQRRTKLQGPLIPIPKGRKTIKEGQVNKPVVSSRTSKIPVLKSQHSRIVPKKGASGNSTGSTTVSSAPQITLSLKDFVIGKYIGGGQYGRVYLAKEKITGYIVALKVIYRSDVAKNTRLLTYLMTEINSQSKLKHKNIIRLFGYFQDETRLFMIIEYAPGGDLRTLMQKQPGGHFSEARAASYTKQIAEGLKAIHIRNIVHRDLKPENILLDIDGNLKIADFGCSVQLEQSAERRSTMIGTIDYMAPEILKEITYGKDVDIWSLGVMIYEMLVGRTPHYDDNALKTQQAIKTCKEVEFPESLNLCDEAKDLVRGILRPNNRLTLTEILDHPFLKKYEE